MEKYGLTILKKEYTHRLNKPSSILSLISLLMNNLHYPDFERCKKLTEIGFPDTVLTIDRAGQLALLPSVMELLDVIPKIIPRRDKYDLYLALLYDSKSCTVRYENTI
jgi:hypothetical protein